MATKAEIALAEGLVQDWRRSLNELTTLLAKMREIDRRATKIGGGAVLANYFEDEQAAPIERNVTQTDLVQSLTDFRALIAAIDDVANEWDISWYKVQI